MQLGQFHGQYTRGNKLQDHLVQAQQQGPATDALPTAPVIVCQAQLLHFIDVDLHLIPAIVGTHRVARLKEYPPEASSAVLLRYIDRYQFLHTLGVETITLRGISPPMVRYLASPVYWRDFWR